MCGCCTTNPNEYRNKYKEKEKGIVEYHPHMLVYSNYYWREYVGEGFKCGRCGTCIERKEALAEAGIVDTTIYE